MVVTRDPALARTIRALRNQGRMETDGWLEHSLLGGNYRLPDINCALGLSQMKRIESILARREAVARRYCELLRACPDAVPPPMTVPRGRISWFAFVIRLSRRFGRGGRDQVAAALTHAGIGCRPYFPPVHLQPLYAKFRGDRQSLPVTEDVAFRTLALPFFTAMRDDQVERVCQVLGDALLHLPDLPST
jgi:perosamine synthetase